MRDSPEMTTDPFSDILKLTNARSVVTGGFMAGGSWAIRFPPPDKIKFSAVVKGKCWVCIDGEAEPVLTESGDVLLLSAPRSVVFTSDLAAVPVDGKIFFAGNAGAIAKLGEGDDFLQIGGHVQLDPATGDFLTDVLPPWIHVRAASPQAIILQWLLDQLVRERIGELPGSSLASAQLAQLVFIQILRAHIETSAPLPVGWLRALNDTRVAPALRLMHSDPGRTWRLEELAKAAAMSRTTFALHFKTVAGVAPLTYLTAWRMRLAERMLREDSTVLISALARSLGYTSESAFSNAFKRATGRAPKHYRSAARAHSGIGE